MKYIEKVRIFHLNKMSIGSGLTIIMEPMPNDEKDITLLGDAIRAAIQEVSRR